MVHSGNSVHSPRPRPRWYLERGHFLERLVGQAMEHFSGTRWMTPVRSVLALGREQGNMAVLGFVTSLLKAFALEE